MEKRYEGKWVEVMMGDHIRTWILDDNQIYKREHH